MYKNILVILLGCLTCMVQAEEVKTVDSVEARQSYYRLLEYNMGALAPMAMGKMKYDVTKVKTHVNNLLAMEHYDTASLFPQGTSKESLPGRTRALAVIWSDFPGVAGKGKIFKDALSNLDQNYEEKNLGAAFKKLGEACMGCHKSYVAKDF